MWVVRVLGQFCHRLLRSLALLCLLLALICALQRMPTAEAQGDPEGSTTIADPTQMYTMSIDPIEELLNETNTTMPETETTFTTTTTTTSETTTTTSGKEEPPIEPQTHSKDKKQESSFWQDYKWYIIGAIIFLLLIIIIVGVGLGLWCYLRRRRLRLEKNRKAESRKTNMEKEFLTAYDKFDDPEFTYVDMEHVIMRGAARIHAQLPLPSEDCQIPDEVFEMPEERNEIRRLKFCEVWSIGSDSAADEMIIGLSEEKDEDYEKSLIPPTTSAAIPPMPTDVIPAPDVPGK